MEGIWSKISLWINLYFNFQVLFRANFWNFQVILGWTIHSFSCLFTFLRTMKYLSLDIEHTPLLRTTPEPLKCSYFFWQLKPRHSYKLGSYKKKMPQSGVGSMQGKNTGNMPSTVCASSMNKSLAPLQYRCKVLH